MGKWLLSTISVVITSQVVCPPGGGEGSVQADEVGRVPDQGIQHRQHTAHAGESGGLGHGAEPLAADGSQLAID